MTEVQVRLLYRAPRFKSGSNSHLAIGFLSSIPIWHLDQTHPLQKGALEMSIESTAENSKTPTTAIATRQPSTAVSTVKTSTGLNSRTSTLLQNAIPSQKEGVERPAKLFDGPIEFSKPGYPPFTLSHLVAYTYGDETLAILSSKPRMITHREAAEQIARLLSINPNKFLYLDRICAGPEGANAGLCRDLLTEYAFEWEWARSTWHATNQTYCYRVSPQTEALIQQLLTIEQPSINVNVIDATL